MSKKKIVIQDKSASRKSSDSKKEISAGAFAFGKENYMIILIGLGVLVIGYLLMIGGGSDKPENFNPEIFSARRITVAPITLLIGFGVVLYGIMKKPREEENQ
ncbi:MAG TPA: DUF3098 domain-containing protein [Bacteroidia bacterium]|jgi:hypothetical protein|nr:DUF3098 domain-containing protein [Bacteroidia bacterium]